MYISVKLQDDQVAKLKKLASLSRKLADDVLKRSIRHAIRVAGQMERETIGDLYTAESGVINQGITEKVSGSEGSLLAATKKSAVEKFDMSMKKPGRSTSRLSAVINKASGRHTMATMFWAFYKNSGGRTPGLYKRNRSANHPRDITAFRTISVYGMTRPLSQAQLDEIEKIFFAELERRLAEV
ncbi:MAG: hypothetical protein LBQ97_02600 [Fusobacteriaceae bacterium]|jgi:hypothetical protein|nr:hypothetical protein [Fusobacteriaceae bacterium]